MIVLSFSMNYYNLSFYIVAVVAGMLYKITRCILSQLNIHRRTGRMRGGTNALSVCDLTDQLLAGGRGYELNVRAECTFRI